MNSPPKTAKEIFLEAIEAQTPECWPVILDRACGTDRPLRQRVEVLLKAHVQDGSLLDKPAISPATFDQPSIELVGTQIGPYKLIEEIGQGGMGVVYMAEQKEPVRRLVALKIVKPGMDSRQVLARFDAERQALAMMDHPNIARIFDAGTTELGRPYFVMELVHGIPINEFCDQKCLTVRQRLELVLQVCRAIQHAHQKGIIHRDLKPSNVLVEMHDAVPVSKVIDFGVAKAIGQQLTDSSLHTGFCQLLGTPLYMSPEQAGQRSIDIDTRSDVYSLGVLLYQILTGQTPFESDSLGGVDLDDMRRMIREVEPPRPSTRVSTLEANALSTISDRRNVEPRKLSQLLRGELDWIVMKAMEKDRSRRYESASSLAADVQRYLNHEPVQACPPSATYRIGKFLQRHQGRVAAVATISALLFTVVAGGAATYLRQVRDQRENSTLVSQSLGESRTAIEAGDLVLAVERVAEAQTRLGDPRYAPAALVADVNQLASEVSSRRTDRERFDRFMKLAPESQEKMSYSPVGEGDRVAREALALFNIANDEHWLEQLSKAYLTTEQMLQVQETAYDTLVSLADYAIRWANRSKKHLNELQLRQSFLEALTLLDQARSFHEPTRAFWFVRREVHQRLGDNQSAQEDDQRFLVTEAKNAWDCYLPGHYEAGYTDSWSDSSDEAIHAYQAALRIQPDHYNSLFYLGRQLSSDKVNRLPEAILCYTACIALRPHNVWPYKNRALCHEKLGHWEDAELDLSAAIERTQDLGDRLGAYSARASLRNRMGRPDKAREDWEGIEQTISQAKRDLGPVDPQTLHLMHGAAWNFLNYGKLELCLPLFEETFKLKEANLGRADESTFNTMVCLSVAYLNAKKLDQAVTLFNETLEWQRVHVGPDNSTTIGTMERLGRALLELQRLDDAESVLRECVTLSERTTPDVWQTFYRKSLLGNVLLEQAKASKAADPALVGNKLAESEALLLAGYEGLKAREEKLPSPNEAELVFALGYLVELYGEQGKPEEVARYRDLLLSLPDKTCSASAWLLAFSSDPSLLQPERAIELAMKANSLKPNDGLILRSLGIAQYRAGEWQSAIATLQKSLELMENDGDGFNRFVLAMAHWQLDQKDEARKWYNQAVEWMNENQPQDQKLLRFRAEATELLGVKEAP